MGKVNEVDEQDHDKEKWMRWVLTEWRELLKASSGTGGGGWRQQRVFIMLILQMTLVPFRFYPPGIFKYIPGAAAEEMRHFIFIELLQCMRRVIRILFWIYCLLWLNGIFINGSLLLLYIIPGTWYGHLNCTRVRWRCSECRGTNREPGLRPSNT